jgi:hypothetical protein
MTITVLISSESKGSDGREKELRVYLELLKENSVQCSDGINEILELHVQFASLMAKRMNNASNSESKLEYCPETTVISEKIDDASNSLSIHVLKMQEHLLSLVSVLEEIQVAVKAQSLTEKLLGWLKYLLKLIVSVVAKVCFALSSLVSRVEPNPKYLSYGISALGKAAANFCKVDPGAFSEHISSCKD